ncbi:MAG: hypothetical protein ACPGNT_06605 [Rhodospirillales bacterium]
MAAADAGLVGAVRVGAVRATAGAAAAAETDGAFGAGLERVACWAEGAAGRGWSFGCKTAFFLAGLGASCVAALGAAVAWGIAAWGTGSARRSSGWGASNGSPGAAPGADRRRGGTTGLLSDWTGRSRRA